MSEKIAAALPREPRASLPIIPGDAAFEEQQRQWTLESERERERRYGDAKVRIWDRWRALGGLDLRDDDSLVRSIVDELGEAVADLKALLAKSEGR